MSFVNSFSAVKMDGEASEETPVEEYSIDDKSCEEKIEADDSDAEGSDFEGMLSLVHSKMMDEKLAATVNEETVCNNTELENEEFLASVPLKPQELVHMFQSMVANNISQIDSPLKSDERNADTNLKCTVDRVPEINIPIVQMPPNVHTLPDIPVLWNTNEDDDVDDDPLMSVLRLSPLPIIEQNCIETPAYIIYSYTTDPELPFDISMIENYANNARPIYASLYEAQDEIDELCEENRKFLEMQANTDDNWDVSEPPSAANISNEYMDNNIPLMQEVVASDMAPSKNSIKEPTRDPRLRFNAPTYRQMNPMRLSLPPQQMSPVIDKSVLQTKPPIPSLLLNPVLPPLPPLAQFSTLPPLPPVPFMSPTQPLRPLMEIPLMQPMQPTWPLMELPLMQTMPPLGPLMQPNAQQQCPSHSPVGQRNTSTAQWTPGTIATVPAHDFKGKANSFRSYRDYRRFKESMENSPTDTTVTATKPIPINPKVLEANQKLFGTENKSETMVNNSRPIDRVPEQEKIVMPPQPIHSIAAITIVNNSESTTEAAKPLVNNVDNLVSMAESEQVNMSSASNDVLDISMVKQQDENSESPMEIKAKKPPKKKSKTKKKKASNALNKSDATAQVQLKSSPGVEIKAPQYSVKRTPSASKPKRKRILNDLESSDTGCENENIAPAERIDEDDIPLGERFRLSDSGKNVQMNVDVDDLPLGKRFRLSDKVKSPKVSDAIPVLTPKRDQEELDAVTHVDADDIPLGKRFRLSDKAKSPEVSHAIPVLTPKCVQEEIDAVRPAAAPSPKPETTTELSTPNISVPINIVKRTKRFKPKIVPVLANFTIALERIRLPVPLPPDVLETIQQPQDLKLPQPEVEQKPIEEPLKLQADNEHNNRDDGSTVENYSDTTIEPTEELQNSIKEQLRLFPNDPDVLFIEDKDVVCYVLSSDDE